MNLKTEQYFWKKGYQVIVGFDEAGRGSLAGPVAAAAVMIKSKIKNKETYSSRFPRRSIKTKWQIKNKNFKELLKIVRDSKKLSSKEREKIFELLKKIPEIKYSFAFVNEKIIDKINIEQATFLAMRKCLTKLKVKPDLILVDGNRKISQLNILQKTVVKGDDKIFSIALASIIAKVMRDRKMIKLAQKYPQYHFEIHKGYPTKLHQELLKKYGPSKIHRQSYQPVRSIIQNQK